MRHLNVVVSDKTGKLLNICKADQEFKTLGDALDYLLIKGQVEPDKKSEEVLSKPGDLMGELVMLLSDDDFGKIINMADDRGKSSDDMAIELLHWAISQFGKE